MKLELVLRPRAEIDLASHFLYLSDKNPQAALRFDKAVAAALKRIQADPQVGARLAVPSLEHLDLRFFRPEGFKNYLIIFRIAGQTVFVPPNTSRFPGY